MNSHIRHFERQTDINGHEAELTQAGSPIAVLKKVDDLENIDRDISHRLVSKKAEKLSTAVYLITGFLSDSEPMKWQIREGSLKVLSDINLVINSIMSEREQYIKSIGAETGRIVSLLEIAVVAGFVSEMNFTILKEEYCSLVETIRQQKIDAPQGNYIFAREFFSITDSVPILKTESKTGVEVKRQNEKETITSQDGPIKTIKDFQENISRAPSKSEGKTSRRETVLRLIKDKGDHAELSIKDIVGHFTDCGEKTIQRELTALVEEGVLKKTGERRWSRYSLS